MTIDDGSRIARDPATAAQPGGPSAQPSHVHRAALRKALLARRTQREPNAREQDALQSRLQAAVESHLGGLPAMHGLVIALYWPIRGEPSLGALPQRWHEAGVHLALPVVQARGVPLQCVAWAPGDPMTTGAYGIATPAVHRPVRPTVLLVPCVGFDRRGFRLGYGGGYYDRTLAALAAESGSAPIAFGVAWDESLIEDTEPLSTDVPLDAVITPGGVFAPGLQLRDGNRSTRSSE